jgi:hypothetical protein
MFLIYIFLHQQRKQCLEFVLPKPGKICKYWLVLAIQTVMPVGYTILILSTKQSREINAMGQVVLRKMFQKSSALSILFETRRSLLQIEFATFAAKKPRPLCEIRIEKGIG